MTGNKFWGSNSRNDYGSRNCFWGSNFWRKDPTTSGNFSSSDNIVDVRIFFFGIYLFGYRLVLFDAKVINLPSVIPWHGLV